MLRPVLHFDWMPVSMVPRPRMRCYNRVTYVLGLKFPQQHRDPRAQPDIEAPAQCVSALKCAFWAGLPAAGG